MLFNGLLPLIYHYKDFIKRREIREICSLLMNGAITNYLGKARGGRLKKFILLPLFWNQVVFTLKVMTHCVHVLHLVDMGRKKNYGLYI